MEILPGVGVAAAKLGETRDEVEGRVGPPMHPGRSNKEVYPPKPLLVVTYADDDTVELVEVALGGDGGEEVTFDGVQLTYRFMNEVVADLTARGHRGEKSGTGYRFEPGFALFSTGSRSARELDPTAHENDGRPIVEGVSVAPYDYFRAPTQEEIDAYIRERLAAQD